MADRATSPGATLSTAAASSRELLDHLCGVVQASEAVRSQPWPYSESHAPFLARRSEGHSAPGPERECTAPRANPGRIPACFESTALGPSACTKWPSPGTSTSYRVLVRQALEAGNAEFADRPHSAGRWKANAQHTLPWRQDLAPGKWNDDTWELHDLSEDLSETLATRQRHDALPAPLRTRRRFTKGQISLDEAFLPYGVTRCVDHLAFPNVFASASRTPSTSGTSLTRAISPASFGQTAASTV